MGEVTHGVARIDSKYSLVNSAYSSIQHIVKFGSQSKHLLPWGTSFQLQVLGSSDHSDKNDCWIRPVDGSWFLVENLNSLASDGNLDLFNHPVYHLSNKPHDLRIIDIKIC